MAMCAAVTGVRVYGVGIDEANETEGSTYKADE